MCRVFTNSIFLFLIISTDKLKGLLEEHFLSTVFEMGCSSQLINNATAAKITNELLVVPPLLHSSC
jgi:hypothetical protein